MTPDPLIAAAALARTRAFAPFSRFLVGAAIETEDGTIVPGCNVESASFGLTICAERSALFRAVGDGHRRFGRIAIVTDTPEPTAPCGACRQLLWEFAPDAEVLLANLAGKVVRHRVRELIPHAFDDKQLGARS
jgi:cytidine deaminase